MSRQPDARRSASSTSPAKIRSGYLDIDGERFATGWMVDSVGQETITIDRFLASTADAAAYWEDRRNERGPIKEGIHG